jgi:hypothetical protein
MSYQSPASILMIRPAAFGFNQQTADSNTFQQNPQVNADIQKQAELEFDRMVDTLTAHDVNVTVFNDSTDQPKPDAVFPNNWISFHPDGSVILYPMMAENRRLERRADIIDKLKSHYQISKVIDLTPHEKQGSYLEGTGSLVINYSHKVIYACRSPRTSEALVKTVADLLGYRAVIFDAFDRNGVPVYHTNVMMSIGSRFVALCLDSITSEADQDVLLQSFSETGHRVIAISFEQMAAFAGNILEVRTHRGDHVVIISETAFRSLLPGQINAIQQHAELLPINISTIEKCGGGSARCMIAGIHLPEMN